MSLLEKFNSIEVKTDSRIQEKDRLFCEAQQKAYDDAQSTLKSMRTLFSDALNRHEEILGAIDASQYEQDDYIAGEIRISEFTDQIQKLPQIMIHKVASYFRSKYSVSIEDSEIEAVLLPQKPDRSDWTSDKQAWKEYHRQLEELPLRWQDIVDKIFVQLGGYTFTEKAVKELKDKCHEAAWNKYHKKSDFELKKHVLSLTSYACSCDARWSRVEWKIHDSTTKILRGLAHYETGETNVIPSGLSDLFNYSLEANEFTCYMEKVERIKLFKNGRVDIRFTSESFATQFAEEYLGTECGVMVS